MKGNRLYWKEEEGRPKEGADRGKSPPLLRKAFGDGDGGGRGQNGHFQGIYRRKNVPFYGEEALWATQTGKELGLRMGECRAREHRYVCDFRVGYEQGGFKE